VRPCRRIVELSDVNGSKKEEASGTKGIENTSTKSGKTLSHHEAIGKRIQVQRAKIQGARIKPD